MRAFKRFLAVIAAAVLALGAVACKSELEKLASGLTDYVITAEYDAAAHTVKAHQRVDYINNYEVELNELRFNMYGNAYRRDAKYKPVEEDAREDAYPNGESWGAMSVSGVKLGGAVLGYKLGGADKTALIIALPSPLYPTERIGLEFDFTLKLAEVNHRTGYSDKTVNLGNWDPIAAVYENGGFVCDPYYSNGDPFYSEPANYDVTLTAPSGYTAASSGQSVGTDISGGKKTVKLTARVVRDFAIVLSPSFKVMSRETAGTAVIYYYYDDNDAEASLQAAVDALTTFNKLFGKYPYSTYSIAQTTFIQGGMEYPNLVLISDRYAGEQYCEIIIHETAHQWWYGVVGNNEVAHAWMDEGLTAYSTTVFYEFNPQYNISKTDRILKSIQNYYIYSDIYSAVKGELDTSMNRPVNGFLSAYEYFYMVYVKGELMLDSLRGTIGDKAFFDGMRKYYADNKYKTVRPEDFIGAMEAASGKDMGGIFKAWLEGDVIN
ncbi:MAG: M1 family metallopeptidase [Clostridiales bacterium]|jgi:hypothetical protein|nr:M1 family metallopeptidase [Clostridiales bacterium]